MDVKEHFYHDDPANGPPDARTDIADTDYFFLGNGQIQAAVQVCRSGKATPLGLLIMSPLRLGPKRAALSFDSTHGVAPTIITIEADGLTHRPVADALDASWSDIEGVPAVRVTWRDRDLSVDEIFFCPDGKRASLVRRLHITNTDAREFTIRTGDPDCPVNPIEHTISASADGETTFFISYELTGPPAEPVLRVRLCDSLTIAPALAAHHAHLARFDSDSPILNHLFTAARNQLPAVLGASGTMDGSIWQYNLEWARDQAAVVVSLAMLGERELARTMLNRLFTDFVTDEGDTVDSGRTRPAQDVELDQNGELLWALKTYIDWTGDTAVLHDHWPRIRAVADFPFREVFRHDPSGLLHNSREYWERHTGHGIEDGMEMIGQFFMSLGLSCAAHLARLVEHEHDAERWDRQAARLKEAMLFDEQFGLVHNGRFVKRRGVHGDVQEEITVPSQTELPHGVPLVEEPHHYLNPDASFALPVALDFIDPAGDLARESLASLEVLWNQRWTGGGYGRYHITSEPDAPGPWPFPSIFIARAHLEAGDHDMVWRILHWLHTVGGAAGTWFEFYGPRPVPPCPQVGIPPWTWAELLMFFIHHLLGIRPRHDHLILRPRLLTGLDRIDASVPLRQHRIHLAVRRAARGEAPLLSIDGVQHPPADTELRLHLPQHDMHVDVLVD